MPSFLHVRLLRNCLVISRKKPAISIWKHIIIHGFHHYHVMKCIVESWINFLIQFENYIECLSGNIAEPIICRHWLIPNRLKSASPSIRIMQKQLIHLFKKDIVLRNENIMSGQNYKLWLKPGKINCLFHMNLHWRQHRFMIWTSPNQHGHIQTFKISIYMVI